MNKRLKLLIVITLVIINLYIAYMMWPGIIKIIELIYKICLPFIIGFIFAFILMPIVDFFNKKLPRKLSVFLTVILFFALIITLCFTIFPKVILELNDILVKMPEYLDSAEDIIDSLNENLKFLPEKIRPTKTKILEIIENNTTLITNEIVNFVQRIISYIIVVLFSFIIMIYFMLYFDKILLKIKEKTSDERMTKIRGFLSDMQNIMRAYFRGVFLISFILVVASTIIFMILDMKYALILGIIIGITEFLPYIGPYIGGGIAVIVALSHSYKRAIIVAIAMVCLQMIENYLLTPKIQSKSINTNPLLILLIVLIFGRLLGIFGMLIAVPFLAFIQTGLRYWFNNKKM